MDKLLHELNRSLRALDEAYRLGEITRDDYRARRRRLISTLRGRAQADPRRAVASPIQRVSAEPAAPESRSWLSAWRERLMRRR